MAIAYNTSSATDGLVFYLDATNIKSYPGSGTTWSDISGNGNNFTIFGSPTYSSTNGWTLDNGATSKYMIKNPIAMPTSALSYEVWCRTTVGSTAILSYASSAADNDFLLFAPENLSLYVGVTAVGSGINITDGNWRQIVRTSNRVSGDERLYINGSLSYNTTLGAGTLVTTNGSFVIGQEQDSVGGTFDPNQAFGGNIAIVKLYRKVLTATEVAQNFEASRGRFGI